MPWFGFENHHASCFLDSVLVALFGARHHDVIEDLLLHPTLDNTGADTDLDAPLAWRQNVQRALAEEVDLLNQSRSSGHACTTFRQLLAAVPRRTISSATGETVVINFAAAQQQSAVDFLHYLFDALCARNKLANVQYSTTFMLRRAELEDASLQDLASRWKASPIVKRFTSANAAALEDKSERAALLQDKSGKACIVENSAGDRRRITAPESVTLFSCHLTANDKGVPEVSIIRELEPHVEHMSSIEGYTGPLYAKMLACHVLSAPLLIIEVSRKVHVSRKLDTRVAYGDIDMGHVVLQLHGQRYALNAVVCHVGNATGGHYVAFVCNDDDEWYFYDDAHRGGELLRLPNGVHNLEQMGAACPALSGELFFYSPLS
jgi:ubiquitin C-terminal hydrolase